MVRPGTWMLEVGLNDTCTITSWPELMSAERAARVVRREAVRRQLVAMLGAALAGDCDAVADLDGLGRIDAHHREREVGVEPVEHRLAEARRHAARARP